MAKVGRPTDYTFIYGLVDPRDDRVRYIGKSNNPEKRLYGHIRDSLRRVTKCGSWIKKLKKLSLEPNLIYLKRVKVDFWQRAESLLIELYRREYDDLLNMGNGGEQPYCSDEVRASNGRKVARKIHENPKLKEMWKLKHRLGIALRQGYVSKETKDKMRSLANRYPIQFSSWSNI